MSLDGKFSPEGLVNSSFDVDSCSVVAAVRQQNSFCKLSATSQASNGNSVWSLPTSAGARGDMNGPLGNLLCDPVPWKSASGLGLKMG